MIGAMIQATPLFVRCVGSKDPLCGNNIFFEDTKTQTRHHVPSCSMCGINTCGSAQTVSSAHMDALHGGLDFDCSMIPGHASHAGWVFDMGDNMVTRSL